MITELKIKTSGQGLYEFTSDVSKAVRKSNLQEGLCTVFVRHTSASLLIQENADPSAKRDLENWLTRLVPEDDSIFTHVSEGPDDMPAHIKAALTNTTLSIPVSNYEMALGTWQGIYLWEHRDSSHTRQIAVYIG